MLIVRATLAALATVRYSYEYRSLLAQHSAPADSKTRSRAERPAEQ